MTSRADTVIAPARLIRSLESIVEVNLMSEARSTGTSVLRRERSQDVDEGKPAIRSAIRSAARPSPNGLWARAMAR
jgi:hypothetical protein